MTRYISTRGQSPAVMFTDAILAGLAPDGGLYVPEEWPDLRGWVREAGVHSYVDVAATILDGFVGDDISPTDRHSIVQAAYGARCTRFSASSITPLVQLDANNWLLELFHGPSLSFKDVAMQLIGPLYEFALAKRSQRLTVVCATSGDTGGAAVEALRDRERIDLFVLLPKGRVSDVQRLFMTASGAANVHAIEVEGDFDACQAIVKDMFGDRDFAHRAALSGVNSINWARIVAQSVYFFRTASALCGPRDVDFVVPSGNFGDAFSGYVAKLMGAPIGRIGIATNANDILVRTLRSGRYERAAVSHATLSPAMDIQVASNFERLIYVALEKSGADTDRLFASLKQSGGFDIPTAAVAHMRETFSGISASDDETLREMKRAHDDYGVLICPHTAVGWAAFSDEPGWRSSPTAYLATAHPAKFPDTVERATGVRPNLPPRCADLFSRTEKFDTLPADVEAVKRYIRERSRAWT